MPSRKQNSPEASPRSNWWIFLALFFGVGAAIFFVTSVITTPVEAQSDPCVSATTQVATDPAADQTGAPLANQQLDIRSISIAEDYRTPGQNRLVFTMKVTNLSTIPANGVWRTRYTLGGITYYVAMAADESSRITYEYGTIAGSLLTPGGAPDEGSFTQDGTIKITIDGSRVGSPAAGQQLTAFYVTTQIFAGVAGTGGYLGMDTSPATATYTMVGKSPACSAATPTPTPTPGGGGGGGTGNCELPGRSAATDAAGDHNATLGTAQQDIREVFVAEPYFADGGNKLVFTMKVESLDPASLPANAIWKIYFNVGTTVYFVNAFNDPLLGASFEYGAKDAQGIDQTQGDADAGLFNGDTDTITITVSNNKVGGPAPGQQLTSLTGMTQVLIGSGQVGGSLQQVDTTTGGGSYTVVGSAPCAPPPTPTPTPPPAGTGPTFTNYQPPAGMGTSAGEPTLGVNPRTGKVMYVAGTQTLRATFDSCTSPATARWENVTSPTTPPTTLDPIIFVDRYTGRTFVSQLLGKTSHLVYSDNDGGVDGKAVGDWTNSQGAGINAGVDHQTVGGGPFAAPLTRDPAGPLYPNAVYYASQDLVVAQAAVSLDGGTTFGPAVPVFNATTCGSTIHGHVKVAPDGTAYLPNKNCQNKIAVGVSEDNGASWTVRTVTGSVASGALIDPSVDVTRNGNLYIAYVNGSGLPFAAMSPGADPAMSKGKGWQYNQRIGAELGIVNATFPQMVAGDDDRAAMAFLGSTTTGNHQAPIRNPETGAITTNGFRGEWHLYIAVTYDGGQTWTTSRATDDPVQRNSICNSGTLTCDRTPNDRNLLDFNDVSIDEKGRILAAYADGCVSNACKQGLDLDGDGYKDNDYSAVASIARQTTGRGLYAQFDPTGPAAPASPLVTATRDAAGVHLTWDAPADNGAAITGYNVYRRAQGAGTATRIATVSTTFYDDASADPGTDYLYHVRAVNSVGESAFCGLEVAPGAVVNACSLPGIRVTTDDTDAGQNTPALPAVDLKSISMAEPWFGEGVNKLVVTVRTGGGALPPNSQWYVIWNRPQGADITTHDRNYVAMVTDATGAPSFEHGRVSLPIPIPPDPLNPPQVGDGNIPLRVGAADAGSYDEETGTITITIANSKVDNVAPPQPLNAIEGRTILNRPTGVPISQLVATDFTPPGAYELRGNAACRPNVAPVAELVATPNGGPAPLAVSFDASQSSDADAGDSVVEYTFTFGDNSAPVTRTVSEFGAAAAQASHTYAAPGAYRATLTVKDSHGAVSLNIADEIINVTEGGCATNWAFAGNGGTATASSTAAPASYGPQFAINGDNAGLNWGAGGGWNDGTRGAWPDSLEVAFDGAKPIHEIRVYTLQDNFSEPQMPNPDMTTTLYGIKDFDVQYWDGNAWVTAPGGQITNNDRVMRTVTFPQVTTTKIRIMVNAARHHHSRIIEVEAIGCPPE